MSLGYLMVDFAGPVLTAEDRELLQHPLVGGVILFTRNYQNRAQLTALVNELHSIRQPPLLIAVDHEGGRVQRFRAEFTEVPAAAHLGRQFKVNPKLAQHLATEIGWLLAAELRASGIDFSFAPVLDLDQRISSVIGDRALHQEAEAVSQLALAFMNGMKAAGMMAVGKHFPGHGSVAADSHETLPIDERRLVDLEFADLIPFTRLIQAGLPAIMPAHVLYQHIAPEPPGFSHYWLHTILREKLRFQGVIFSDDLSMAGAAVMGDVVARAEAALMAGCDMLLVCNDRSAVLRLLTALRTTPLPATQMRLMRMHGRTADNWATLQHNPRWQAARQLCAEVACFTA